jgi:hypothetical protein
MLETTARSQWAHVIPRTWKVVVPTNVRGVVFIMAASPRSVGRRRLC